MTQAIDAIGAIDPASVAAVRREVVAVRERGGRLFVVGSGGGAGHASHAVNDFRKICHVEAYAPTDNVSELTARVNDEGWETSYAAWLVGSRFRSDDLLFVFSVGGGDVKRGASANLVMCMDLARDVAAPIVGVVGRDGGYLAQVATAYVLIPVIDRALITPHTEGLQAVVWHAIVSHPELQAEGTRWESLS